MLRSHQRRSELFAGVDSMQSQCTCLVANEANFKRVVRKTWRIGARKREANKSLSSKFARRGLAKANLP